jgi:hypothetical protein
MALYDEVEVFETYSERWIGGFEVADRAGEGDAFLVRRQNDGVVLPAPIPADRIRAAHSAPRSV